MNSWILALGALLSGVSWYYVARGALRLVHRVAASRNLLKPEGEYRPVNDLSWMYFFTRWAIVSAIFAGIVSLFGIDDLANLGMMMFFFALFNAIFLLELRRDNVTPFRYLKPEAWKLGSAVCLAGGAAAVAAMFGPAYFLYRAEVNYIRDMTVRSETREGVTMKAVWVERVLEIQRNGTLWFEIHPRGEKRIYLIEESPDHNALLTDLKSAVAHQPMATRNHLINVKWRAEDVAATKLGVERVSAKVEPAAIVLTQVVTL